jgi:transcriptional regulator with XRE-family HTH domain
MDNALRQNIVQLAKDKNYTYRGLEKIAGLHKNFLSGLLAKDGTHPRIDSIIKLADALEVTLDELVGRSKNTIKDNILIHNKTLLVEVINFLIQSVTTTSETIKLDHFLNSITELYLYSLKKGSFDKDFSEWFVENNLFQQ